MSIDLAHLRRQVHQELLQDTTSRQAIDEVLVSHTVTKVAPLLDSLMTSQLIESVLADVHGMGPLEPLLADPTVTDVMVVGGRGIWVERGGVVEETGLQLTADEVFRLVERIVAPLGLRVDRASPMVDARLPDGSRVNVIVPPLAIDGPCVTIRRFGTKHISLEQIAEPSVAELLTRSVRERRNILISGGTGAGKTTLLNALAMAIEPSERVITIEDAAELRLPLRHVVRLEGRPANAEGAGLTTLRELVRNALRMRPDRIIVGEVRGAEALDMLQAMNTGHEGSMSTCHANSPLDALSRVETMVLMADVALSLSAIRQQIASSIDLVVQVARTSAGRRIVDVSDVIGVDGRLSVRQIADRSQLLTRSTRPARRELTGS